MMMSREGAADPPPESPSPNPLDYVALTGAGDAVEPAAATAPAGGADLASRSRSRSPPATVSATGASVAGEPAPSNMAISLSTVLELVACHAVLDDAVAGANRRSWGSNVTRHRA